MSTTTNMLCSTTYDDLACYPSVSRVTVGRRHREKIREEAALAAKVLADEDVDGLPSPTFRCASPSCPGYPYRASERPHPGKTCGPWAGSQASVPGVPKTSRQFLDADGTEMSLPIASSIALHLSRWEVDEINALNLALGWSEARVPKSCAVFDKAVEAGLISSAGSPVNPEELRAAVSKAVMDRQEGGEMKGLEPRVARFTEEGRADTPVRRVG